IDRIIATANPPPRTRRAPHRAVDRWDSAPAVCLPGHPMGKNTSGNHSNAGKSATAPPPPPSQPQPDFVSAGSATSVINVRISYRIIELFSQGLYRSPGKAIEELVANS